MDTFSYHCPMCSGEIKLNISTQKLWCEFCGQNFDPETQLLENMIATPDSAFFSSPSQNASHLSQEQETIMQDFIEMNLYHCGNCGADVITNDVEVTKFCSFCGQSAIIYDKVTKINRPDLIIPFSISKTEALSSLKTKYANAKYLPPEFNTLSVDSIYEIYVPYYVFDATLNATGYVNVPARENSRELRREYIGGRIRRNVFFDSSKKLNDNVSIYLNPFPYNKAIPFDPIYLSGFYADIADVDPERLSKRVESYLWEILGDDLMSGISGIPNQAYRNQTSFVYKLYNEPLYEPILEKADCNIENAESVLCPVYFVTLQTSEGLCNILINGCTGKVVGSIPASNRMLKKDLKKKTIIMSTICGAIMGFVFAYAPLFWSIGIAAILGVTAFASGSIAKKQYEMMMAEMNTSSMFRLRRR